MACVILYQAEKKCVQQGGEGRGGRNLNFEYRAVDRCKTGVTYDPEVEYVC